MSFESHFDVRRWVPGSGNEPGERTQETKEEERTQPRSIPRDRGTGAVRRSDGGLGNGGQGGSESEDPLGDDAGEPGPQGGSGEIPLLTCVQSRVTSGTPVDANTVSAGDEISVSCGSGTGADLAYEWDVPLTDYYTLSTLGSDFDTVLAVLGSDCSSELACNNNVGSAPQSEIVMRFQQGERVAVIVDGNLGEDGNATLSIDPVTCPETDLSGQPLPAVLTTVGSPNQHLGSCGGDGQSEKSVRFTAPTAGIYQFSVTSSEISPALYLEAGARCGAPLLGCTAGAAGGYPTEVTRKLEQGQVVSLIVDSTASAGALTLDARLLEGVVCPSGGALPATPQVLDEASAVHVLSGSCAGTGATGFSGPEPFIEHSYPLALNLCPTCSCAYRVESDGPISMYLLRGTECEGDEIGCVLSEFDGSAFQAAMNFGPAANGNYVLVIESMSVNGVPIEYAIEILCIA